MEQVRILDSVESFHVDKSGPNSAALQSVASLAVKASSVVK